MASAHLLVLVHGMWGNPGHLAELNRIILDTIHDPALHVLCAETNREDSTYDGIDWGGERVAQEISDEVEKLARDGRTVTRFSITGYSLGGLVARYVVGYPSLISSITSTLGPKLLSRTGEQFYCVDKWSAHGRPLLEVMADPDRIFYQALAAFETIRIYANAVNDLTVPYVTAAIELEDPFAAHRTNGLEIELDEKHSPLIKSYALPPVPPPPTPKPTPDRPFLPPVLQFRFPMNILLYTALPLLAPVLLSLIVVRLSLATRSSRARIKLLERDASASNTQRLVHVLAQLEHQVETAVVDLVIDDAEPPARACSSSKAARDQPILTPTQRRIAAALNRLPILRERAWFPDARNSHAVIICRDVRNFEAHRAGEGVLRHWAGAFVL
ncbi:putative serine esterase-domain-containing protein [Mycena sp. CBHHK59/15]|nr:putative serine esterase-domain-containing protein [Mycena sp. CBHHK59/15]